MLLLNLFTDRIGLFFARLFTWVALSVVTVGMPLYAVSDVAINKIAETSSNSSHTMKNGAHVISLRPGQLMKDIDFGNQLTVVIQGKKWNDQNGNGKMDAGERGLPNVTIFLDLNNNGVLGVKEPRQITNKQGHYKFSDLKAGTYVVREVVPAGYRQTYPPILRK